MATLPLHCWFSQAVHPAQARASRFALFAMFALWGGLSSCGSDADTTAPPPPPPPSVARVDVTPDAAELRLKGDTVRLTATAYDQSGNVLSGKTFTWFCSATEVATVTAAGVVTAQANGSAAIRATVDGVTGEASFTVAGIGPQDMAGGVEQFVTAALGDTLVTGNGIVAVIPPGALPADTTIKVVPVPAMASLGAGVMAVRFEPDGLVLNSTIEVSFPLPLEWTAPNNPLVLEFMRDEPGEALSTDTYAEVTGSPGDLRAVVLVSHFSGVTCAENCHAGTIHHLLKNFQNRGCSKAEAIELVRERSDYLKDKFAEDFESCGIKGNESHAKVQGLLDLYFDELGTFNEDTEDVYLEETIADLIKFAKLGRKVVIAFRHGQWEERDPNYGNFYRTFKHTAALEVVDGEVVLRNSLALSGASTENNKFAELLNSLDEEELDPSVCENNPTWPAGEPCLDRVLRYPLYKSHEKNINVFRKMATGEAVERHFCKEPGCLSEGTEPLIGLPWEQRKNSIPWGGVKIYMEKMSHAETASLLEGGALPNPCVAAAAGEGTLQGSVVHEATGGGIQGATVIAMQNGFSEGSTTTNAGGGYALQLRSGMYELQVDAAGFDGARSAPTEVRKNDTTVVEIALTSKEVVFTETFTIAEEDDGCGVPARVPDASGQLTITVDAGSHEARVVFSGASSGQRSGVGCEPVKADHEWSVQFSGSFSTKDFGSFWWDAPDVAGLYLRGDADWRETSSTSNCTRWGEPVDCPAPYQYQGPVFMSFTGTANLTTGKSTGIIWVIVAPNAEGRWGN